MRNWFWQFLLGSTHLPYEHRQTILICSSGSLVAFVAFAINLATGQHMVMTLLAAAAGVLLLTIRKHLVHSTNLQPYIAGITTIGIVLGVAGWLTSEGLFRSAPY